MKILFNLFFFFLFTCITVSCTESDFDSVLAFDPSTGRVLVDNGGGTFSGNITEGWVDVSIRNNHVSFNLKYSPAINSGVPQFSNIKFTPNLGIETKFKENFKDVHVNNKTVRGYLNYQFNTQISNNKKDSILGNDGSGLESLIQYKTISFEIDILKKKITIY